MKPNPEFTAEQIKTIQESLFGSIFDNLDTLKDELAKTEDALIDLPYFSEMQKISNLALIDQSVMQFIKLAKTITRDAKKERYHLDKLQKKHSLTFKRISLFKDAVNRCSGNTYCFSGNRYGVAQLQ